MAGPRERATRRERPLGVVIVALFLLADAVIAVGQVVLDTSFTTRAETLLDISEWMPAFVAGLGMFKGAAAVGLWLGHRWAWVVAMLTVGIGLLMSFYVYWVGDPSYVRMLINVVMAFYLNQGAVRDYFEHRARDTVYEPGER